MSRFQVYVVADDTETEVLLSDTHDRVKAMGTVEMLADNAGEAEVNVRLRIAPAAVPPLPSAPETPPPSQATQTAPETQRGRKGNTGHWPQGGGPQ